MLRNWSSAVGRPFGSPAIGAESWRWRERQRRVEGGDGRREKGRVRVREEAVGGKRDRQGASESPSQTRAFKVSHAPDHVSHFHSFAFHPSRAHPELLSFHPHHLGYLKPLFPQFMFRRERDSSAESRAAGTRQPHSRAPEVQKTNRFRSEPEARTPPTLTSLWQTWTSVTTATSANISKNTTGPPTFRTTSSSRWPIAQTPSSSAAAPDFKYNASGLPSSCCGSPECTASSTGVGKLPRCWPGRQAGEVVRRGDVERLSTFRRGGAGEA